MCWSHIELGLAGKIDFVTKQIRRLLYFCALRVTYSRKFRWKIPLDLLLEVLKCIAILCASFEISKAYWGEDRVLHRDASVYEMMCWGQRYQSCTTATWE